MKKGRRENQNKSSMRVELDQLMKDFISKGNTVTIIPKAADHEVIKKRFEQIEQLKQSEEQDSRKLEWKRKSIFRGIKDENETPV